MSDLNASVEALADKLKASVTDPAKQEMLAAMASDAGRVAMLALPAPEAAAAARAFTNPEKGRWGCSYIFAYG